MLRGRIIKALSGFYYVETSKGTIQCRARGIFRKDKESPLVGDFVDISITHEQDKEGVIENIYKRKSQLKRPPVANVDLAIIVFAIKNPDPHLSLLDRFITLAEREGLDILIVFNKIDLDEDNELNKYKDIYIKTGYRVIGVSADNKIGIEEISKEIFERVAVFAGPSGVGKSSLLNALCKNLNLQTGSVSEKIGRGKHTTRHAELVKLDTGGMVADTPGFSSLSLDEIESNELKDYFIEFHKYANCKFANGCIHKNEPGCGVKQAVEEGNINKLRYESYLQLLNELIEEENRRYK